MSLLYTATNPQANAGGVVAGPFQLGEPLQDISEIAVQGNFTYGSGGTSADYWLQTSFDGGATFNDVMNFHFLLANKKRVLGVSGTAAVLAAATPTFHTLAADTAVDGMLGAIFQIYAVVVGNYAGGTVVRLDCNRRLRPWKG